MAIERDRTTWLLYLLTSTWGWTIYAFGPSVPLLGEEAGLTAAVAALHGTGLALGGLISGLGQARLVRRYRRRGVLWRGSAVLVIGVLLLLSGGPTVLTLTGAVITGVGGTLVVNAAAAAIIHHHGRLGSAALSEANAIAAGAGALAPFMIAAAVSQGLSWRVGLAMVVPFIIVLAVAYGGTPVPSAAISPRSEQAPLQGRFWWAWGTLVCLIGVEFCFSIWGSVLVAERSGQALASGTLGVTGFVLGIGLGRAVGSRLALRFGSGVLLVGAIAVALLGWGLVWTSTSLVGGIVGMVVAGIGVALHFPLGMSRLITLSDGQGDRASGMAAIGAGLAIGLAPFALGWISDRVGIHSAFLIVPGLLCGASVLLVLSASRPVVRRAV